MRHALLALVAGCGFHITTGSSVEDANVSDGSANADGDVPSDGSLDAPLPDSPVMSVDTCLVRRSGASATGTLLGGTGGARSGDVTCPGDKVGVGLQFDVTPNGISTHANQIVMTTIRLWCGTITRDAQNQMHTSNLEAQAYTALQGSTPTSCDSYKPPTQLGQVMCPNGAVLVAVLGHQIDTTLYNNVSIQCAAMMADGRVSTSIVTIPMPGTGSNNNSAEQTQCPASTAITSIHATSGCGQDGATASCTATLCEEIDQK